MSLLAARDVWLAAPGSESPPVVQGVSLDLERGEWVALTGPNGCGKSSLGLALAGLRPFQSGTIEFAGRPVGPGDTLLRESVGVVLQEPSCQLFQSSVAEEMAFTARNLGRSEDQIEDLVARWSEALDLEEDLGRDPRTLSAGGQQLTLLAAALVARPQLLVADEAGAHLDPAARARVLAAIRAEAARDLAVLWITQEPEEMAAADRSIFLGDPRPGAAPHADDRNRERIPAGALAFRSPGCSIPSHREDPALLTVTVSPWTGAEGPHVRVRGPRVLNVPERGVTALAGRNGAGKSVLLEAVAGITRTPQVRVTWAARSDRAPILASQYPETQLFEEKVEDEIVYAAVSRGMDRADARNRAMAHLEAMGVVPGDLLARRCWDRSAGEKRLVQAIGALIAPASVVLLDEPSCGLDAPKRLGLARLVVERARRDPVLVASQDGSWVALLGARVHVIGGEEGAEMGLLAQKTD